MLFILVIKAQVTTAEEIEKLEGNSLKFPDEDDVNLINSSFNGTNAQILIPTELLHQALNATSKIFDYYSIYYDCLNN